jgi:hypothetical protein
LQTREIIILCIVDLENPEEVIENTETDGRMSDDLERKTSLRKS